MDFKCQTDHHKHFCPAIVSVNKNETCVYQRLPSVKCFSWSSQFSTSVHKWKLFLFFSFDNKKLPWLQNNTRKHERQFLVEQVWPCEIQSWRVKNADISPESKNSGTNFSKKKKKKKVKCKIKSISNFSKSHQMGLYLFLSAWGTGNYSSRRWTDCVDVVFLL